MKGVSPVNTQAVRDCCSSLDGRAEQLEPGEEAAAGTWEACRGCFTGSKESSRPHDIRAPSAAARIPSGDQTAFHWKKMPPMTFIAGEERSAPGFRVAKGRRTLSLAAGDRRAPAEAVTALERTLSSSESGSVGDAPSHSPAWGGTAE